ncbi:hypothetical protein C8R43DRAFT_1021294 [Mycena crocata]|nr:hypothetical protein C8R43DRAFT_1021294 [Mycena crocata]
MKLDSVPYFYGHHRQGDPPTAACFEPWATISWRQWCVRMIGMLVCSCSTSLPTGSKIIVGLVSDQTWATLRSPPSSTCLEAGTVVSDILFQDARSYSETRLELSFCYTEQRQLFSAKPWVLLRGGNARRAISASYPSVSARFGRSRARSTRCWQVLQIVRVRDRIRSLPSLFRVHLEVSLPTMTSTLASKQSRIKVISDYRLLNGAAVGRAFYERFRACSTLSDLYIFVHLFEPDSVDATNLQVQACEGGRLGISR